MIINPVTQAIMDMRQPTDGMRQNGQSNLYDALGAEMNRQKKLKEIRIKYGQPEPLNKPVQAPNPQQWVGDNNG